MDKKKIIISHPTGNMNVRVALHALKEADMLDSFHTSVACFKGSLCYNLAEFFLFNELRRRMFDIELRPYTHTYPFMELGRNLAIKLHLSNLLRHETGIFCIDRVYKNIDKYVSIYIKKNYKQADAVYTYEDCALETFKMAKKNGLICFYDLPTGYWRAKQSLLEYERANNPKWAVTLNALSDSEVKLYNKDAELSMADKIFVASTFTKKTLKQYSNTLSDIKVIPYGFPIININRHYKSFNGRKIKALFVGGLSQQKGLSYLFDAVREFKDKIELTVVGRGDISHCPALKYALNDINYIPSLAHTEILKLMSESDVFVFPSLFDGFGLVITEAMSQGTPVITTERTCGPDIIINGQNGWIVKAGKSDPIKILFAKFIESPELLQHVGRAAMATAAQRPWMKYETDLIKSVNDYIYE